MKTKSIEKNLKTICLAVASVFAFELAVANPQAGGTNPQTSQSGKDAVKSATKETTTREAATKEVTTKDAGAKDAATKASVAEKKVAPATTISVDGLVHKVVSKKKEIYVNPADGSKKMEFYFPENAEYLKAGQAVGFDALKEGQRVRVSYTKTGKRLNPTKVEILD